MHHPFPLLRQFSDRLDIRLLTKTDHVRTDAEIKKAIGTNDLASLWQVHGNRVTVVDAPTSRTEKADGLATDRAGLTLTIRAADCQPILLYAPNDHVLCLVHAGWRGMKAQAISAAIDLLKLKWSIDPSSLFAAAGPSLCQKCAEFSDPETEVPELKRFIIGNTIDLQKAADHELIQSGVRSDRIDRPLGCTKCQSNQYWSYRGGDRDAVKEGWTNCLTATMMKG